MAETSLASKKETVKQVAFATGSKFRLNKERNTPARYQYIPSEGAIIDNTGQVLYEVLEINGFSVKVRVVILGQIEAIWCRFETFIFDAI